MGEWKVLKSTIVHQTDWIEIVEDMCEWQGKQFTYTYTRRVDEGPLIVPESKPGVLWMVSQYRHPIGKWVWQFPAEGMHEEENWEMAAIRGVGEELGLGVGELIHLGWLHPDPGGLQQKSQVFLARDLENLNENMFNSDPLENLTKGEFSLDEIERMIESGEICDGWTLSGLYLYRRYIERDR